MGKIKGLTIGQWLIVVLILMPIAILLWFSDVVKTRLLKILAMDIEAKRFNKALIDLRAGKDIDLTESEFEVFWAIHNDGVAEGYKKAEES